MLRTPTRNAAHGWGLYLPPLRGAKRRSNPLFALFRNGLLRGACHRARIRATHWLGMTVGSAYFAGLGSIGVVPRRPRISSSTLAPARSCASPRGGATTCSPTGSPDAVNPQGRDSAVQHTSVIA